MNIGIIFDIFAIIVLAVTIYKLKEIRRISEDLKELQDSVSRIEDDLGAECEGTGRSFQIVSRLFNNAMNRDAAMMREIEKLRTVLYEKVCNMYAEAGSDDGQQEDN